MIPQEAAHTMFQVRPATVDDKKQVLYLIDEAAKWLRTKGTNQWATPWPNREARDARVERDLCGHRTWMVEDDGMPIATITCSPDGSPRLWTESQREDLAVYVSRLVVSRSYAGRGLGAELIDWAGKWARQQYSAQWIRIDVWTTNIALHSYYKDRGFRFLKFCEDADYPSAALFQKATATCESAQTPRLRDEPELVRPRRTEASRGSRAVQDRLGWRILNPSMRVAAPRYFRSRVRSPWAFAMSFKLLDRAFAYMLLRYYEAGGRLPRSRR